MPPITPAQQGSPFSRRGRLKRLGAGNVRCMDQMEKTSAVRTRRYNHFPRTPAQEGEQPVSETLTAQRDGAIGTAAKPIWFFEDGSGELQELLGGKGAGLAEMTRAGLPVPPGFTLTTEVCLAFFDAGRRLPEGLPGEIRASMRELERRTGKGFGLAANPLLVSVRSGARVSMPGMMDTILNLGLNDETVAGLAKLTGNDRFAYDAYRRFMAMFGNVVLDIPKDEFDHVVDEAKQKAGVATDPELTADRWKEVIAQYREIVRVHTGEPFPQDVHEQLELAIGAVFDSWHSKRAIDYRKFNKIPDDWGTACSVCSMVFGNLGDDSGTGVAFTRDPNTGEKMLFGEYLRNAQGEDVVAGIRTPMKISDLQSSQPDVYAQFVAIAHQLETHYRDMQDLEFTVERGKLWMLQTRSGKRSAEAAVRIALDLVHEGIIDKNEALRRVDAASLDQLFHARIDPNEKFEVAGKGLNASPGAATGQIVFDADTAATRGHAGEDVILVRVETAPDDVHGMIAAKGVLTSRGGATSHAAVVARGMGKPCVAGFDAMTVDYRTKTATIAGTVLKEGDWVTIDGTTGNVAIGKLTLIPPPSKLPDWLAEFLTWADEAARLEVWANADTPDEARKARELGATGIGLTPDRAHVHAAEPLAGSAAHDHQRYARSARRSARATVAVPKGRLLRDPRGDGRVSRYDPPAGPAAARVPPRRSSSCSSRRRSCASPRARAIPSTRRRCACWDACARCTSRTRCSACACAVWASCIRRSTRCKCARFSKRRAICARAASTRSPT